MLGNVYIKDTDGNISYTGATGNEKVTGLLFDVSLQPELFTAGYGKNNENNVKLNDVLYVTNRKSAIKDFGIIQRVKATEDEENNVNFFHGIPYYHISEFFRLSGNIDGNGRLYVMFADCSAGWDTLSFAGLLPGGVNTAEFFNPFSPARSIICDRGEGYKAIFVPKREIPFSILSLCSS